MTLSIYLSECKIKFCFFCLPRLSSCDINTGTHFGFISGIVIKMDRDVLDSVNHLMKDFKVYLIFLSRLYSFVFFQCTSE